MGQDKEGTVMPFNFNNRHVNNVRRSPMYRVLQVLPTPARPWLLALETITELRERRMQRQFGRREDHLLRQLDKAKHHKRGGLGLGRMLFAAGLTLLASQLNKSKQQGRVRSTPLMKTPQRDKATSGK